MTAIAAIVAATVAAMVDTAIADTAIADTAIADTVIATIIRIIITIALLIPNRTHKRIDVKHQNSLRNRWRKSCARCRVMRRRKSG